MTGLPLRPSSIGLVLLIAIFVTLAACAPSPDKGPASRSALVELGESIFLDASLSADRRVSCSSCHDPRRAFTDGKRTSVGVYGRVGTRNAPSLLDIATMKSFFWDGRETNLKRAVLQPFTNPREMGMPDIASLASRLEGSARYSAAFSRAFGNDAPITAEKIAASLVAYLLAIPQHENRYDNSLYPDGKRALNDEESAGLELFSGKAGCAECHRLKTAQPSFTDNLFHHAGIGFGNASGNISALISRLDTLKRDNQPIGTAILAEQDIAELGKFAVTRRPADLGAFRTPTLRNVAATPPYMHDGSIGTLAEAVDREIYYRSLARGRPISLTVEERRQLLAFLGTLSRP
jgi:cytochrome c peroxidase